jgi:hypothetical protein
MVTVSTLMVQIMNKIGLGIFCFGDEFYFNGTLDKIKDILDNGYYCHILTDNVEFFNTKYSSSFLQIHHYHRDCKSYSDKIILVKKILKHNDICIILDADSKIEDNHIFQDLKNYNFKSGVSYISTLLNHPCKKNYVEDFDLYSDEWRPYTNYARTKFPPLNKMETIWEYFLVFNKFGFNEKVFYIEYEKLQIAKEYSDIQKKDTTIGAGEGMSIMVSAKISDTPIQRDEKLYELLKNRLIPISKNHPIK